MGAHIPPDHSLGDESTVAGYAAVHGRPPAFEGPDGMSYSVEVCSDETDDETAPWGAYLLFLRWRRVGDQGVEAHVETDFIVRGDDEGEVLRELGRMPLRTAKATLDALVRKSRSGSGGRRWWDVMKDERDAPDESDAPDPTA